MIPNASVTKTLSETLTSSETSVKSNSSVSDPKSNQEIKTGFVDLNAFWYVVHCVPHKEAYAAFALNASLDLEVYTPKILRRRNGESKEVSFFSGYLFIHVNLQIVGLSSVNQTPGVVRLLNIDGSPQKLANGVVEAMKVRIEDIYSGHQILSRFKPGDAVRLEGGPLKGMEAIFLGQAGPKERIKVLMEFLGQPREVPVEMDWLEFAPNSEQDIEKRDRRTRGRGRPVRQAF